MFSCRVHEKKGEVLVAACDESLLDKRLREGELEFHVSPGFYGGETIGVDELRDNLRKASIVNAVGNKVVEALVEDEIVEEESIIIFGGVSHAQVVVI